MSKEKRRRESSPINELAHGFKRPRPRTPPSLQDRSCSSQSNKYLSRLQSYPHQKKDSSNDQTQDRYSSKSTYPPPKISKSPCFSSSSPASNPDFAIQRMLKLPNPSQNPAQFMICFNDNWVCACLPDMGGVYKQIENVNGNVWTPFYISFNREVPAFGEFAQLDYLHGSDSTVFDVYKLLDLLPTDKVDTRYPYEIGYTGEGNTRTLAIETNTCEGKQVFDLSFIYTAFIIAMRKEAERVAGNKLFRVFIKKTGRLNPKFLKDAVQKADLVWAGCEPIAPIHVDDKL